MSTPPPGGNPPAPPPAPQFTVTAIPNWKISEELPELTEHNYPQWHATLIDILTMHDLADILDLLFIAPPTQHDFYAKAMASCRCVMAKSIPQEIKNQLPATIYSEAPHSLVSFLKDLLQCDTADNHAILEQEAKQTVFEDAMTIKDYVTKHRSLRARMQN